MKITIIIDTDNAAFEEGSDWETARILHKLSSEVAKGHRPGALLDINGNRVGSVHWDAS